MLLKKTLLRNALESTWSGKLDHETEKRYATGERWVTQNIEDTS